MDINSWNDIGMKDLFYAFRKAKADCFFENSICISEEFAKYENTLADNLRYVLNRLHENDLRNLLEENLGDLHIVSKKLSINEKTKEVQQHSKIKSDGHIYFSSSQELLKIYSIIMILFLK